MVSTDSNSAIVDQEADTETEVAEPKKKPRTKSDRPTKRQPRYNVILWDDNDHTYDYVIRMMMTLFGHELEQGFEIAVEVDTNGRAICLTTTMEHAELKRDQIHAYGKDRLLSRCEGSMWATIEPVTA